MIRVPDAYDNSLDRCTLYTGPASVHEHSQDVQVHEGQYHAEAVEAFSLKH